MTLRRFRLAFLWNSRHNVARERNGRRERRDLEAAGVREETQGNTGGTLGPVMQKQSNMQKQYS